MKSCFNNIKNNLLFIILVLQPFLDILAFFQQDKSVSIAGYFRLGITLALPLYTLFFTKRRKGFIVAISVIGVFSALHVLNGFRVGYQDLYADVKYLLLVAHAILLLYSFMYLYEKESIVRQIKNALKLIIPIIAITFYLSYFLKSGFYTYFDSYIGWTGWNVSPSVFSIILSAIFPFAVYFCINNSKKWLILLLIPLSYIYILNATKATYMTLIATLVACALFWVVEFFVQKRKKFPYFAILFTIFIAVSSIMLYDYSPRAQIDLLNNGNIQASEELLSTPPPSSEETSDSHLNETTGDETTGDETTSDETTEDEIPGDETLDKNNNVPTDSPDNHIKDVFEKALDPTIVERFGVDKYLAAYEGRMTAQALLDNRVKKKIIGSLVWDETDLLTKFVGFEEPLMTIGGETYDLETDPHAIFFYYGYIGSLLYAGMLIYFWLRLLKQLFCHFKDSCNLFNFVIFIDYSLLMVSALYTGYLLRRPNSGIYLTLVLLLIYCQTEPLFKRQTDRVGKK